MNEHVDELGARIVKASTAGRDGLPRRPRPPRTRRTTSKSGPSTCAASTPSHRPLITKELVDYWCLYGSPEELREKTQLMIEAGVDMVSVFLSNPFTAERDIDNIGSSILAHA